MLNRIYSMKNMPGFFFVYILLFCLLGIIIMGFILGWVYSDFSPRNEPIIKYEGSIKYNDPVFNNFETNREIHNYRFQGIVGQEISVELSIDPSIRYGTKLYLNNPEQMYDLLKDSSSNKLNDGKAIIGEKILLKNNGTFTLSIDYDFERHSNYYDFEYFFMFWDREREEWVNDFPEYNFVITSKY